MPLLKHVLGVGLGEGFLSLLCLRSSLGTAEVAGVLRLPLPETAEAEERLMQEISAFLMKNRIPSGLKVVVGVPRAEFLLRRFDTPPVKARLLPPLVEFEIERHLPGKREEFLSGWRVAGRRKGGGQTVLLGAVRRAALQRALDLLKRAKIAPVSIQPEPLAFVEVLRRQAPDAKLALVLTLGRAVFSVDIVRAGRLDASRSFKIEGSAWGASFSDSTSAEGEITPEARNAATLGLAEQIVARIRHPLFLETLPDRQIPELRIVGYGVNRSLLIERLQDGLRVPVRVFSPWSQVRWTEPAAELAPFTIPLVLALQGIGERAVLELAEERQEELHRAPRRRFTMVLAGLCVGILIAQLMSCQVRQRRHLALVEREIRALKVQMTAVDLLNRQVQDQRQRLRYLRATIKDRPLQIEILKELTALIPDDAYLSEYAFKSRALEITGLSPSASRLLPILEGSPLFREVEFSAPIVAQGGGLERFRIRMNLERSDG